MLSALVLGREIGSLSTSSTLTSIVIFSSVEFGESSIPLDYGKVSLFLFNMSSVGDFILSED